MHKIIENLNIRVIHYISETDTTTLEIEYSSQKAGEFLINEDLLSGDAQAIVDDCKIKLSLTSEE